MQRDLETNWKIWIRLELIYPARAHRAQTYKARSQVGSSTNGGPSTYAILSRNLVLSRFIHFLKDFRGALNKSQPSFIEFSAKVPAVVEHSTKVILLSWTFH